MGNIQSCDGYGNIRASQIIVLKHSDTLVNHLRRTDMYVCMSPYSASVVSLSTE
jgi:hypothetical protein